MLIDSLVYPFLVGGLHHSHNVLMLLQGSFVEGYSTITTTPFPPMRTFWVYMKATNNVKTILSH